MDSQLVAIIVQAVVTITTTLCGVAIAYIAFRNKMLDKLGEVKAKVDAAALNIEKVEHATNSMKDQLVAATKKLGLREGADIERERAKAETENASPLTTASKPADKLVKQIKENKENADDMAKHLKDVQKRPQDSQK